MEEIIYSDRYDNKYPDPRTMCTGDCEGMGIVPVKWDDEDERYREKWREAENENPDRLNPDIKPDYHFVPCNQCEGTGLRSQLI